MGLLYFIPDKTGQASAEELVAAGIRYAFDRHWVGRGVRRGPAGGGGLVIADDRRIPANRIVYQPEVQTWRRAAKGPGWVGRYTQESVEAQSVARDEMLRGHQVRLGDDQEWLIPVARAFIAEDNAAWYIALPEATDVDDEGNWVRGGVVQRYRELWEIAQRWWDAVHGAINAANSQEDEQRVRFLFEELNDAALLALSTNYRVGRAEVGLLGLFDDQVPRTILNALVDMPTIEAWLKKKGAPAGSTTDDGPAVDGPNTDPA